MTKENKMRPPQRQGAWLNRSLSAVALGVFVASSGAWAADPDPICNPDKLYDTLSSSFHQTVAQLADNRGWAGWGQEMGGTRNVAPPESIMGSTSVGAGTIGDAFPDVKPLLVTTGSQTLNHQTVALGNDGKFYAWGNQGIVLPAIYTSGTPGKAVQQTTLALPSGVNAGDVEMLFTSSGFLALVTKIDAVTGSGGDVYTMVSDGTAQLLGDGTTTKNTDWHQVKTDASTELSNVIAVRGQVGAGGIGAAMALTADGKVYTWGGNIYKGDGTGRPSNVGARVTANYATQMTLPAPVKAGAKVVQIGVTGGKNTTGNGAPTATNQNNSYYVLFKADDEETGELWSLGANTHQQLGTFDTAWSRTWQQVRKPTNPAGTVDKLETAPFADVKMFSVQEHDWGYAGSGSVAAIDAAGDVYTWGSNNGQMLGHQTAATTSPQVQGDLLDKKGSGNIKARYVEVGGHTTAYSPQNSPKFCYVGHKIAGSMGDNTGDTSNPWQFDCDRTPAVNICGADSIGAVDDVLTPIPVPDVLTELTDTTLSNVYTNDQYRGVAADGYVDVTPAGIFGKVLTPAQSINWGPVPYLDVTNGKVYAPVGTPPGDYTITYEICDVEFPTQICATANITASILGLKAVPDTDTTGKNTPVTTKVTDNDTTPSGSPIDLNSVTVVNQPPNGTVACYAQDATLNPGECKYTPSTNFTGTDTYTYQVCNLESPAECDTTTVTIAVDEPPAIAAYPDTDITTINVPAKTPVLGNDIAVGSVLNPASVELINGQPTDANVVCADGYCSLTSNTPGTYTYDYKVCLVDPAATCTTSTVTVVVAESSNPVDPTAPAKPTIVATPDFDTTPVNTPVTTTVVGNDNAVGGVVNPSTVVPVGSTSSKGGAIVQDGNGKIKYTPPTADFVGTDTYQYQVCMAAPSGDVCTTTTVTIKVGNPSISAKKDEAVTPPGTPVDIPVLENDEAVGGEKDPTSVTIITPPTKGTVICDAEGVCTYTPNNGFEQDEFTYQVCMVNPKEACATAKVTIEEKKVIADDDSTSTAKNSPVDIPVLDNDVTYSGNPLNPATVKTVDNPTNGTVAVSATGVVTYTPNTGFTGTDTFTYEVCDVSNPALCDTATVTIDVVDQPVVANDDEVTTPPNTPVDIPVLENDTGGPLDSNIVIITPPANGTLDCNTETGVCTYTPTAPGPDQFTYKVCAIGNPGSCDEATVTINTGEGTVVALDDFDTTKPSTPVETTVTGNDVSNTGSALNPSTVEVTVLPGSGAVSITDGKITYTPVDGFTGEDTYRYRVCDSATPAVCDEAKVTIFVGDITAVDDEIVLGPNDKTGGSKDVTENDTINPGTGVVTLIDQPTKGTVSCTAAGVCTYTPGVNWDGSDEFTYKVCSKDYPEQCDEALVTIKGTPEMVPTLDLPPPAKGKTYTPADPAGTLICTNVGTAAASNVSCEITDLPPGLVIDKNSCTPVGASATSLPIAGAISCPITGTPTGAPGQPVGTTEWENPNVPSNPPQNNETGVNGKDPGTQVPVMNPNPAGVPVDNPFALLLLALGMLGLGSRYARKRNAA